MAADDQLEGTGLNGGGDTSGGGGGGEEQSGEARAGGRVDDADAADLDSPRRRGGSPDSRHKHKKEKKEKKEKKHKKVRTAWHGLPPPPLPPPTSCWHSE